MIYRLSMMFSNVLIFVAQRTFSDHPQNYTAYKVSDGAGGLVYNTAAFQCTLGTPFYVEYQFTGSQDIPRPSITWELRDPTTNLVTSLTDFTDDSGARVIFQYDLTGYLQLHYLNQSTMEGLAVRCIATSDGLSVYSDEATLTFSSKHSFFIIKALA